MSKLPMCRICLVENVRMYAVVNKNLHELYEKLTGVPFVTQDTRPIVACSFCCAKLKKCFRFMRKCLESEELFTQMMNEDYQLNPSTNHDPLEFCSGFKKCAVAHISVVDGCQRESFAVKEELPDVCETQDDIIEPKEEYQSDDLEAENQDNTSLGMEDMLPHISDSDSESDVPLTKIKTEVENRRAQKTNRSIFGTTITGTSVTKKAKLETLRLKQEGTITVEIEKIEESTLKLMEITQKRTSRSDTYDKKSDQRSLFQVEDFREETSKGICENEYKFDRQQNFGNNKHLAGHIGIDAGEEHFKCDVCQRSFISNNDLETHIREHTGEQYRCDVCKLSYSQRNTLMKHINEIHTSKKPYKCYVCRCSFKKSDDLKLHIRKHIFGDTYFEIPDKKHINKISKTKKCDLCGQTFAERNELREHIKTHGAKPYKCNVCQHGFDVKSGLMKHIQIHSGEKPYKCDICQRCFNTKSQLGAHIRIHTGEKPYKCDICQSSFIFKSRLNVHIRLHTGEKPFKCAICQRSFNNKSHYNAHMRGHTGEKPFKCDICHRSYSIKSHYNEHIRVHTGEKQFKCDICQRSYIHKSHYNAHIREHTGDKPFKCDICQRSFVHKSHYTAHIRVHTGEKPFKCDICQRSYRIKSHCNAHMRVHTNKIS